MNEWLLYCVLPCTALAALFYCWPKWLNWREKKRLNRMTGSANERRHAIFKNLGLMLMCAMIVGCTTTKNADGTTTTTLDPAIKAAGTHAFITAITAAEARIIEKATGRKPEPVAVVPAK